MNWFKDITCSDFSTFYVVRNECQHDRK